MGASPLTWEEIESWSKAAYPSTRMEYVYIGNGMSVPSVVQTTSLSVWELLTIKTISEAYASEYSQASEPSRPAPWTYVVEDVEELDRVAIGSKMKAIFRSLKKS